MMLKRILPCVPVVALLAALAPAADVKDFHDSWQAVQAAAKEQGKPIYLHFTTDWCHWCRVIEEQTYPDPKADEALQGFVAASLDCTQSPDNAQYRTNHALWQKFGGSGYPYLVMVSADGEAVLNTIGGFMPPEAFVKELAAARELYKELHAVQTATEKDSLAYHARAAEVYGKVRLWDRAAAAAEKVLQDAGATPAQQGMARLALLEATMGKPVAAAGAPTRDAKIKQHLDALRELDPKNEQGLLERTLLGAARWQFAQAQSAPSRPAAMRLVARATEYLETLTTSAEKLREPQAVWATLAQAYLAQQHTDKGADALRKAYEADPSSPLAARIQQVLEQLPSSQPQE